MQQFVDVLIVGSGIAGLFCALNLPNTLTVCLITKEEQEKSDSYLAQGGICTLKDMSDYKDYFEDTMKAGHYENDAHAVRAMICDSQPIIKELIQYGVAFDKDHRGFHYTKEGAHSSPRILHHKDSTGKEIVQQLLAQVKNRPNISLYEHTTLLDILTNANECKGAVLQKEDGSFSLLYAKTVVLATGGIGGLFEHSTNYPHITGDALAIAIRHKIQRKDMNYIQIHPTSLYSKRKGRRFLISESMRGEGATLLDHECNRFVDELLPRDLLTQKIHQKIAQSQKPFVWLSIVHMNTEKLKNRFPGIYSHCLQEGYDITHQPIPVVPAQHYFMGGLKTDLFGRTSMRFLYAIGETACNGVHGKNRLASNSLLESLVFAKRAAQTISALIPHISFSRIPKDLSPYLDLTAFEESNRKKVLAELKYDTIENTTTESYS